MKTYHFIGIKGAGMSPLAQIVNDMGFDVQGSDIEQYIFTQEGLETRGIKILNFDPGNIKDNQIVIVGNAFSSEHIEVQQAKNLRIPIYRYHEFLGKFINDFTSIAITGTHGKTSTTGLLAHVFKDFKPTSFLIGDGTGKGIKNSEYFIFEACEYRRHFLSYQPTYAIITNIDFDHPDYFKDIDDVSQAFGSFASNVQKRVIAYGDDPNVRKLTSSVPISYYGLEAKNDCHAKNVRVTETGTTFDVEINGSFFGTFEIDLFGNHNVLNTLGVIFVGYFEGLKPNRIQTNLKTFTGVKRRFEVKKFSEQIIIDDYAHHPTEIRATIEAAKQKYPRKQIVAIFQPHTYSRTKKFIQDFADSLSLADTVYLCDIFGSARESEGNVSIEHLGRLIPQSQLIETGNISKLMSHGDSVLLFMGAGDIQKYEKAYEEIIHS